MILTHVWSFGLNSLRNSLFFLFGYIVINNIELIFICHFWKNLSISSTQLNDEWGLDFMYIEITLICLLLITSIQIYKTTIRLQRDIDKLGLIGLWYPLTNVWTGGICVNRGSWDFKRRWRGLLTWHYLGLGLLTWFITPPQA